MFNTRVGRWTVIGTTFEGKDTPRLRQWLCRCDCGTERLVEERYLKRQHTKSCGCWKSELLKASKRKGKGVSGRNQLLGKYQRMARDRNLTWDLTTETFTKLTSSSCYYCGLVPSRSITNNGLSTLEGKSYAEYKFNGIDRKDNSSGYSNENCVPCCWRCNRMKAAMSEQEFINHIRKIAEIHKL